MMMMMMMIMIGMMMIMVLISKHMENKNIVLLSEFASYCQRHPNERFWQALRNWSEYNFILVANKHDLDKSTFPDEVDTFYFEDKNK